MTLRVRAVSDEEREELGRMARSRTVGAGLVRRARIIVHALEGLKAPEIGARMDLCGATVRHWLKRFNARGLEEDVRTGRPPTYSAEDGSTVIDTALTRPADLGLPFAAWTLDRLAAGAGHRHAPQPDQRDPHPGGPEMAARGGLVRRAGRPGVRP